MGLGVLLRATGMAARLRDKGKLPPTGFVRSAVSALVMVWDMPMISFVFRIPERFLAACPSKGAALCRVGRGVA